MIRTNSLFGLLNGLVFALLGVGIGALCIIPAARLIFVKLPIVVKLRGKKILTSNFPLWEEVSLTVLLVVIYTGACWLVWRYQKAYWVIFCIAQVLVSVLGLIMLRSSENLTEFIVTYRKYLKEEFLKEGATALPAERVRLLIEEALES